LKNKVSTYAAVLQKRQWLSDKSFELILKTPAVFEFEPGQRIRLSIGEHERDYSIVSSPQESELALCIRMVAGGKLSVLLSVADIGTLLSVNGPTGTGIAPFCSMARSGITGFTLLHGVSLPDDMYYASQFRQSAQKYIPCLTGTNKLPPNTFKGGVTEYLDQHLTPGTYDFYLCGRSEMIRDVTLLIDERFPGSLVYTEQFY
jgi:NAD(P)H-flavin reductase